jgi:hypothetical protein
MLLTGGALAQALESLAHVQDASAVRTTQLAALDLAVHELASSGLFSFIKSASPAA